MKKLAAYSKGRFCTFSFSLLAAISFFAGALVSIYSILTDQGNAIGSLLSGNLRGGAFLTGHLAAFLAVGLFCLLLAFLSDFLRQGRLSPKDPLPSELRTPLLFLKLILSFAKEQDNIIGDLLDECERFQPRVKARRWLYKQVIKSILPLILKAIRQIIASKFNKWIN